MLQIIRHSSFKATPWKNGGGITHEALRMPADGDPFRFRVSVAQIDSSGPFSDFAAYDRKMVLLRGDGIRLNFGSGVSRELRAVGDLVEFDGAVATDCTLLSGACVDLNLMVLKSERASVRVVRLDRSLTIVAAEGMTLVFSIAGTMRLEGFDAQSESLEPWDLALVSNADGTLNAVDAVPGGSMAFVATLG